MKIHKFSLPGWMLLVATMGDTSEALAQAVVGGPVPNAVAAAGKPPFCYSEELLEQSLRQQPALAALMQSQDKAIQNIIMNPLPGPASFGGGAFIIPVVVYVVHQNGPENISDLRVQAQLTELNTLYSSCGIKFCLATKEGSSLLPGPTPGIFHVLSPLTDHHIATEEGLLKALSPVLPADRYLRIWVVKNIDNGSGVAGYAQFPGTVPPTLDGIVMRYDFFGDITTLTIPNYNQGKILAHEAGHYLNLYHTFHGGCAGMSAADCATAGDRVCDTPPVAVANTGCPTTTVDSCIETPNFADLLQNHMDYTDDTCRNAFTTGQGNRMNAAINLMRPVLVSPANLVYTGVQCAGSLNAAFLADNYNPCVGTVVTFTPASNPGGTTYNWDFGDGNTGAGNPATHSYSAPGTYVVTLTVTLGADSASSAQQVFVSACSPINSSQGNWYFGSFAGLNFSSGIPLPDLSAYNNTTIDQSEGCATQSDPAGNLLFYSDGINVWDQNHVLVNPSTPLTGHGSSSQSAFSVPRPGAPNQYYLFTVPSHQFDPTANFCYTIVDVTSGNVTLSAINTPVPLPAGATSTAECITGLQKCNGIDYWVMVKGYFNDSAPFRNSFYVYSVTASGVTLAGTYPFAGPSFIGQLKMSPDGTLLANTAGPAVVCDFDRAAGVLSNPRNFTKGDYGITFSPNSHVLYLTVDDYSNPVHQTLYQYDLLNPSPAATEQTVATTSEIEASLQIGPNQKVYMSLEYVNHLAVINFPNNLVSAGNPNACGYSYNGPSLITSTAQTIHNRLGLPNMMDAVPVAQLTPDFSYTVSSCLTVAFHAPPCAASYAWDFGDSTSSSLQNPTHTYAAKGTYTVKLTLGTTTVTKTITFGITPLIAGPATVCLSLSALPYYNYSAANTQTGLQYSWSVTGGTISGPANANNVNIVWTTLPGTVTLTLTDPTTGCVDSASLVVIDSCLSCTTPPQITCAPDKTVNCVPAWSFDTPTATDACNGASLPVSIVSTVVLSGPCPQVLKRTWQTTDSRGNSATCSQKVTVVDTCSPTVVSVTADCTNNQVCITFSEPVDASLANYSIDNGVVVLNAVVGPPDTICLSTTPFTLGFTYTLDISDVADLCGNVIDPGQFTFDCPCLAITCATNKTVDCNAFWYFDQPIVVDNCCGLGVTLTEVSTVTNGTCPKVITRTWGVSDDCLETNFCSQTVTLSPIPPGLTCVGDKTVDCNSVWVFDPPTVTDPCPVTNVTVEAYVISTVTNGVCPKVFTRTWQATNICGQSVTCTQTVTVVDTIPPVIACSLPLQNLVPNPSFENNTGCPFDFSQIALAPPWFRPTLATPDYFNFCASSTLFQVPANGFGNQTAHTGQAYAGGHMFNAGGYREYIATPLLVPLAPGHTYQVEFYVSLAEYTSDVAVDNLGAYFSVGPLTDFTIVNALPVTPQVQNPSGIFLSSLTGWMLVQGTYTAAGGETHLTIGNFYDTASTPTVSVPGGSGSGSYYFVDDVSVEDNCVPYPTNKTVNCSTNWNFDTPIAVDWCSGTNVTVTILSSVTNSSPCPTVITRTWLVSDLCSNSLTWTQTVTVVDTVPPVITCADNKTVECGHSWNLDPPTAVDACCSNVTVTLLSSNLISSSLCKKVFRGVWRARDCCTNSSTCTQTVAVVDFTPPVITCANNKTVECGTSWNLDPPSAFDACCSNVTFTLLSSNLISSSLCEKVFQGIWQAMDCCTNISTCTQTVSVVDTTPPVITGCTNILVPLANGQSSANVNYVVTATDACSNPVTLACTPPPPGPFQPGTTLVTCVAVDACTNTNTCQFTITVTNNCPCPDAANAPTPPNDLCVNAIPISTGIYYGYTYNATPSLAGALTPTPCGQSAGSPDVWYTFTTNCPGGIVTLDTCPDPCGNNPHFDTVLSVYTGACPLLSQIVCNNNNNACTNFPLSSKVSFNAQPCVTYYIRVAGHLGATGCFALNATFQAVPTVVPANDVCAHAVLIKCNETRSFNTCMATTGGPVTPGCTFDKDIWFKYVPTCNGTVSVDTCGSFFDTVLGVYHGTCNNLILDTCNNNATAGPCAGSSQSYLTFQANAFTTYFIRVGGSNGAACTGKLTVIGPNPQLGICPPNNCGVKRQRLFSVVGTSTGNAWSWCLSSPCCFNLSGTVPAGTVPAGQPASALVAAMVASINAACPNTAFQLTGANASKFTIKACICANCPTAFPFVFRVGAAGASCDDLCVVNSPIIVSTTAPCVFNPSISEVPLSGQDCNQNGEDDTLDLLNGTSQDNDENGVPDECAIGLNVAYDTSGDEVVISWAATDAILEQSTSVTGPWDEVLGATSPYSFAPATGQIFFRLRLP